MALSVSSRRGDRFFGLAVLASLGRRQRAREAVGVIEQGVNPLELGLGDRCILGPPTTTTLLPPPRHSLNRIGFIPVRVGGLNGEADFIGAAESGMDRYRLRREMAEEQGKNRVRARKGRSAKAAATGRGAARAKPAVAAPPDRVALIERLQAVRKRPLIAYVTSTRVGSKGQMSEDAIRVIYEHLRSIDLGEGKLDLFIHTDGGDATVPWRLMNLVREFASEVALLVPHHAYSAGTLAVLGADRVVMGPMGVLGPTDTQISGPFNPRDADGRTIPIQVEDVLSYLEWVKEDVGINHEEELLGALGYLTDRVNPLALGIVKRSVLQSGMMGERLLGIRSDPVQKHDALEIVATLGKKLFFHGHPINRREAREDLNLTWVVNAEPDEETAMWDLYEAFEAEMRLREPFSPTQAAITKSGGKPPPIPERTSNEQLEPPANVVEIDLEPQQLVWIESAPRADCCEEEMTVTVSRSADGAVSSRYLMRGEAWVQKR